MHICLLSSLSPPLRRLVAEFQSNRFVSQEELENEGNTKPVFYKRSSYLPTHGAGGMPKEEKKDK